jgi:serine/threonine-protein kinase RsbW
MDDPTRKELVSHFQATASMDHWEDFNEFIEQQANHFLEPGKRSYSLRLACEELLSNIIRHADASKPQQRVMLELKAYLCTEINSDRKLTIQFEDDGAFFDPHFDVDRQINKDLPASDRPIGGLGLFLVQQSVDQVNYQWADMKNQYQLTMKLSDPS